MRITSLRVEGFGVWNGLELSDLAGELIVFYGPNEAGKTTLVEFVRSMFYGFSQERRSLYLPPVRGGIGGGTVRVADRSKSFTIGRRVDDKTSAAEAIVNEDGQDVDHASTLPGLLGGVDETIFNNVFVFGLREIQEFDTLTDTQAAEELYNLALGLDRVSLVDVLAELEASRNRLLGADDRPSLVNQLLGQRERLQGEIDALSQSTLRYVSLASQRDRLAADVRRLEADLAGLEREAHELALARGLLERWQERAAIDDRLRSLAGLDALPSDALTRFERIEARMRKARRQVVRIRDARRQLRSQIEQIHINESLYRQAMRLEALAEQQPWIASLEDDIARLEAEIASLEAGRKEDNQSSLLHAAEPISSRSLDQLRSTASALRKARRQTRQLQATAAAADETAGGLVNQLGQKLGETAQKDLTPALAEAGELVSRLRERVQLDERLGQMSRREAQLEEQSHEHLENQQLPAWALVALGSLFVLGCGLVLLFMAGLVLPVTLSAALGWPVGLIGVLAAGAAAGAKFALERNAERQLDACHAQLELLGKQIEDAKAERDALDAQLPRGGGSLVSRLQAAEKELARLEELLPMDSRREAAQREADTARRQALEQRSHYRRLRGRWRELLAEHRLPAELTPAQFPQYCRRAAQLRTLDGSIAVKRDQANRLRSQFEAITRRIAQAVSEAGTYQQDQKPLDQLRRTLGELAEQQQRVKHREQFARQADRLGRKLARWTHRADRLRHSWRQLLRAAGTGDVEEFRRRAAAQAEAAELQNRRAALAAQIEATLAGQLAEKRLSELLSVPGSLQAAESSVAEARRTRGEQLTQALITRGEINQQLKMLVDDRSLANKRLDLGAIEKRLQDALDRWRVLTVCRKMLDSVRDYYEREHQPQALREASDYLERMTAGRYTRVWTPLGQHTLRVDDVQGSSLGVDVLSRGTREQVFLALRLALVSAYARRGARLPLVLDDVLVNFDISRAKAAAAVLRDFARAGHQILIFTCHEHIARLFKQAKADVRQLPDNSQLAIAVDEQPPRRTRRARAPAAPLPRREEQPQIDEVEEAAEPAAELPPPLPAEMPRQPQPRSKPEPRSTRVEWSAEEFEGELADRVRDPRAGDSDDAEAA